MSIDFEQFEKINYKTDFIARALVENNADPLDSGRLQVRIMGIHSFDGNETPVDQLPWAEPALGLSWSGGYNIKNQDYPHDEAYENTIKNGRYNVGNNSTVMGTSYTVDDYPSPSTDAFEPLRQDPISNACGTGGDFVIPRRGNWVFVFFEGGNHDKPIYFSMAPMKRDWDFTKSWRNIEVEKKIEQLESFREDFEPREESKADDESWAKNAIVNSLVDKPDLKVQPLVLDGEEDTSNRDIQCITSANGTTIIMDQRGGREQIFVIHKNYMEYTDKFGNRKIYVGKKRGKESGPTSVDIEDPCHYEMGVEGNHELHVYGNYDLYAKGRMHIQCDSHVQIDAKNTVGLVVREGDVDVLVENGNVNADISGNLDADVKKNLNAKIKENANILVEGNLNTTVNGSSDLKLEGEVKITSDSNINLVGSDIKLEASNIDMTVSNMKISGDVNIGGNVRIGGQVDISKRTSISNQLFVDRGISCGGFIKNKGLADLGGPVIAHGLQVVSGPGSGSGRGARGPQGPDAPTKANIATRNEGIEVVKDYLGLTSGDSNPVTPSEINP